MRTLDPQKNLAQRAKILSQARGLFARKGFAETSMSEIGRACRLTKPALYHYFKGKEAILSALFEETWKGTEQQILKLPKGAGLEQVLVISGNAFMDHMCDPRNLELCKITIKENAHNELVHRESVSLVKPRMERHILALFGPFFKKGTPAGDIRLFAFQFFGSLFYYMFLDKMLGEGKNLPAGRQRYLKTLAAIFARSPR